MSETRDRPAAERDYAVGRGRPPLATRFGKGNTAARGRRNRREKSFLSLMLEALDEPVVDVAADGRRRKVAKRELGLRRLADRVADGDPQAIKLVLGVVLAIERRRLSEPEEQPSWAPVDKAVIENLRALLATP
jgi:Family of unknown function (DUF5681)